MSDKMTIIPFKKILNRCLNELANERSIFGIPASSFRKASEKPAVKLFDRSLETICGPAAGPHTQLAQNIVCAYLCGARFFELKTVQKLDGADLPVSKPCIWAKDEAFNVEWSTELLVSQAMDEYIKAWFLLHVLSAELKLGKPDGFIFNMSVGYDLEGIKLPKIDAFIEGLKDATQTAVFAEAQTVLLEQAKKGMFSVIDADFIGSISPQVCNSVTLSTLHGCPSAEIEKIASYLITEKKLHTFIKCNPTLLGYKDARSILDSLGFTNLHFGENHFEHDLQFDDATALIRGLQKLAAQSGKIFGVKLTNTFPVKIVNGELPGEEMYMSGKALYPLSLLTAQKLSAAFAGKLRISFSGGADACNIRDLCETGMYPITVATTVLKPGGYERFTQIADECAQNLTEFDTEGVIRSDKLDNLCAQLAQKTRNLRAPKSIPRVKIRNPLPLTDCFAASCKHTCPIKQDIPEYIAAAAEGNYAEALQIITAKNPLPFMTGTLCNHRCTTACVRRDYDESVRIREIKLLCAEKAADGLLVAIKPVPLVSGAKTAVIGAGPAGLAAAYFLRRAGIAVTVFDRQKKAGGVVRSIIPPFRIDSGAIDRDVELIAAQGVEFKFGKQVQKNDLADFDCTILAVGAWKGGTLELETDKPPLRCFDFLADFAKSPAEVHLGESVAVIGAGNSAMDACRAALRVPGVKKVCIVYRRTKEQMPADAQELSEALAEGAQFFELLAPVSHKNSVLTCEVCELGEPDASGRRGVVATGKMRTVNADTVISAVGEKIDEELLSSFGVSFERGKPTVNPQTLESNVTNMFVAGDARRGPATIVEAIADAKLAADAVAARLLADKTVKNTDQGFADILTTLERVKTQKHGVLKVDNGTDCDGDRCFACNLRCGVCAEVCPNRANMLITAEGRPQIVHLDALCNECGNCEAFCPWDGAPYREKLTYFSTEADFSDSKNPGFFLGPNGSVTFRLDEKEKTCALDDLVNEAGKEIAGIIQAIIQQHSYVL